MAWYMVELPHSPDQCNLAMKEIGEKSSDILENAYCSCPAEHKCWATVQADNEAEARRKFAGDTLMANARAYEVNKMSVKAMEEMHM